MLKIGPETFSRMAAADLDAFVRRLAAFVYANVPGMKDMTEPALVADIHRLKDKAAGFGLKSEGGVAAYVVTAAYLGLDFPEKFAGARQILFSGESEERKAELLGAFTATAFEALAGGRR